MQLLTVGAESGDAYLWARVFEDAWTAFAPDFEEIDENREYVEREDEFDLPGVLEKGASLRAEGSASGEPALQRAPGGPQEQPFLDLMTPLAGAEEDDRGYTDAFARDVLGLDTALLKGPVPSDPDEDPRPLLCFPLRCRPREGALDGAEARGAGEEEGSQGGEEDLRESGSRGGQSGMDDGDDEQDAGMEHEALPQEILPDLHGEEAMVDDVASAFIPTPEEGSSTPPLM
ncbi:hypothetical protein H632_c4278p0 [Helicosporidium sp. ATCC 50920]|nr:hypothetical protein H632_c4278p0 [Helicosporidium sp. ATCC 50920]|eukprot:KDD71859.1 hypothetical protein H632_c4278p0 [Helicosporidium sp. ATCC 50920]